MFFMATLCHMRTFITIYWRMCNLHNLRMLWLNTKFKQIHWMGFFWLVVFLFVIILLSLSSIDVKAQSMPAPPAANEQFQINVAGATFPYPLIQKWVTKYEQLYPNVQFNYQALGSGTGVKDFIGDSMDFDASDAPLSKTEAAKAGDALHIPETIGAAVVAYNLPGIPSGLNLTGDVIANIYLGKINTWNDTRIQSLNPGFQLPAQPITTVHRSDGSGTTFVFTSYLSKVSPDWSTLIGNGKSVSWPTGVGYPQNIGVAEAILKNPYSIGYVELAYVLQHNMTAANIQNAEGTAFIAPSEDSISNAVAASSQTLPASNGNWSDVSIVNSPGNDSYPISSMTYLLVHQELGQIPGMTKDKALAIIHLIYWIVNDGQSYASSLQYVPLPANVQQKDDVGLSMITYNGQSLYNYQTVPEFGQVVPLIFAISIISIIAITHKTRFSL